MTAPLVERLRSAVNDAEQRAVHSWSELAALLDEAATALEVKERPDGVDSSLACGLCGGEGHDAKGHTY